MSEIKPLESVSRDCEALLKDAYLIAEALGVRISDAFQLLILRELVIVNSRLERLINAVNRLMGREAT